MNIVFHRPVRIEKALYARSPLPVTIDDKHAKCWFIKELLKTGQASLAAEPAPSSDESADSAPKVKASKSSNK